jgi:hypothetical protein
LFEYGAEATKKLSVIAADSEAALNRLSAIEKFLMANYQLFSQLPEKLVFYENAIIDCSHGKAKILAIKAVNENEWRYKLGFVRDFACKQGIKPQDVLTYIFQRVSGAYLAVKYKLPREHTSDQFLRLVIAEVFDGPRDFRMQVQERIDCLNHIKANMSRRGG